MTLLHSSEFPREVNGSTPCQLVDDITPCSPCTSIMISAGSLQHFGWRPLGCVVCHMSFLLAAVKKQILLSLFAQIEKKGRFETKLTPHATECAPHALNARAPFIEPYCRLKARREQSCSMAQVPP